MDFWVAIISGGAAVLGATVGGLVAALPAWGAEKRAAEAARRNELRATLLGTLAAIRDSADEYRGGVVTPEVREAATRFMKTSSDLGTVLGKNEGAVSTHLSSVMASVMNGHPGARQALVEASILLPSWFRGASTLQEIETATLALPSVPELEARDAGKGNS